MTAYYNENDPNMVGWLRELIYAGMIAPGVVDDRSIEDVVPSDLNGFTQCHFFAGIGGWSYALRQAGWNDARPIWTGSTPCQPFSSANTVIATKGFNDERHLWPAFFHLIINGKPESVPVIGEQVAFGNGFEWIDLVSNDLENNNYAFGVVNTCACGFGAPHIRQRLYWLANPYSECIRMGRWNPSEESTTNEQYGESNDRPDNSIRIANETGHFWSETEYLLFKDKCWRPIEPGTLPMVTRLPDRLARLQGYGNSINIAQAQHFIEAIMEII